MCEPLQAQPMDHSHLMENSVQYANYANPFISMCSIKILSIEICGSFLDLLTALKSLGITRKFLETAITYAASGFSI